LKFVNLFYKFEKSKVFCRSINPLSLNNPPIPPTRWDKREVNGEFLIERKY